MEPERLDQVNRNSMDQDFIGWEDIKSLMIGWKTPARTKPLRTNNFLFERAQFTQMCTFQRKGLI